MPVRFVCLANSYKERGRCVAGIMLDRNNNPIIQGGFPRWIRPISDEDHGEIRVDLVDHIHLLDIVEIEVMDYVGEGYQSENVTFLESSIRIIGTFDPEKLYDLCEERPLLFGNKGKVIHLKYIDRLFHSLTLVRATNFEVIEYTTEDVPDRKKIRLSFIYKGIQYDFPITDPVFKQNYQDDASFIDDIDEALLTLSVGVPLNDWHYKLVAGVIVM
ncbi:MAG TPA: hypothetical protein VL978_15535 [Puia sp.]|nr:hypothetical protein [Puia sp.]